MLGDFITGSGSSARAETTRERKKKKKKSTYHREFWKLQIKDKDGSRMQGNMEFF